VPWSPRDSQLHFRYGDNPNGDQSRRDRYPDQPDNIRSFEARGIDPDLPFLINTTSNFDTKNQNWTTGVFPAVGPPKSTVNTLRSLRMFVMIRDKTYDGGWDLWKTVVFPGGPVFS
jgi:hypothetical protein